MGGSQKILGVGAVTVVVPQYEAAITFYVDVLGFDLIEDSPINAQKRWVLVAAHGGMRLLLAKAANDAQRRIIGNQTGGRVFLFLYTDDFPRDYALYRERGVRFEEQPRQEPYGMVAVFQDPFGNRWDLIESQVRVDTVRT